MMSLGIAPQTPGGLIPTVRSQGISVRNRRKGRVLTALSASATFSVLR